MSTLPQPDSWAPDFKLPHKTAEDVCQDFYSDDDPYNCPSQDLFHMSDIEAGKIKAKYLEAYPFMDAKRVEQW